MSALAAPVNPPVSMFKLSIGGKHVSEFLLKEQVLIPGRAYRGKNKIAWMLCNMQSVAASMTYN